MQTAPAAGSAIRSTKAAVALVVLMVVLFVELRLRFGLGALATLCIGVGAIWHTCFRRPEQAVG